MDIKRCRFIDLTHTLTSKSPTWDASCDFQHTLTADYAEGNATVKFRVGQYKFPAGMGTHLDAPNHCFAGAPAIDELMLDQLISPCVCIDVSKEADQSFLLTTTHIRTFEKQHRAIAAGDLVIINTGWAQHWLDPTAYRNAYHFPSLSAQAADYLVHKDVVGLGIDTLSPDCPDSGFPVHQRVLGANKYIIENVAHADKLPPSGAWIMALPLKVQGGTEAPIRLIAMIAG